MEQKVTSSTTKGLVIGLIIAVVGLIIYFMDVDPNGPVRWVNLALLVFGVFWAVASYGKQINYNATFGNYFGYGFKTSAVITAITVIYILILVLFFPDFKEKGMEAAREKMRSDPKITKEQMEQGLAFVEKSFSVLVVATTMFFFLIVGVITSLIAAAVTKKNPGQVPPEFNQV